MCREIREETGLHVNELGPVVFLSQHLSPPETGFDPLTAFGFEVTRWEGSVEPGADDEDVRGAAFTSVARAVNLLKQNAFAPSVEPAIAYLSGRVPPGTTWLWRVADDTGPVLGMKLEPRPRP